MSTLDRSQWSKARLGDIGQSLIGLTYSPSNVKRSGTLVLRSSNIQDGELAFDDNVYVDCAIPEKIRTRENDILICVRNGSRRLIGKSATLDRRVAGQTFGAFMAVYRSDLNPFLRFFFQSDDFKRQIDEHLGATINQITNGSLNGFVVALPSKSEQEAITARLQDADRLITTLKRLISKKQAIKQGVIQKIVSDLQGETRTLGNIGVTIRGVSYNPSTDLRSSPGIDSVDLFRANNIQGSRLDFSDMQYISARRPRMDQFLQEDDILICSANGSKRLVGKAALVGQLPRESTFGAFMMVYRPDPDLIDPIFAALQFQTRPFRDWIDVLLSGSSINNLRPRDVTSFEIVLPSSDEQREIAQIIRDIDAEIDALERRLESARNIKQGMMQELLTGRTRLPVEEVSS